MITLILTHQKGSLSYEKDYGHSSSGRSLSDKIFPDKHAKPSLFKTQEIELNALNNSHDEGEVVRFESYSTNLCIDPYVVSRLTGFRSDVIEGTYVDMEEQTCYATKVKASIICECIAACTLKYDGVQYHTMRARMAHAPSSECRLMEPQ